MTLISLILFGPEEQSNLFFKIFKKAESVSRRNVLFYYWTDVAINKLIGIAFISLQIKPLFLNLVICEASRPEIQNFFRKYLIILSKM